MENDSRSIRDEFDRMFIGQNPTDSFAQPNGGSSHRYSHQQPPLNTTMPSSSSLRSGTTGTFRVDNSVFPFMNNKQQQHQLPAAMGSQFGPNPIRSIHDHVDRYHALSPELNDLYDYCCNSCHPDQLYCLGNFHPGSLAAFDHHRSSLNDHRNLDIDFSRLNISSPNHPTLTPIRNSPLIDSYMGNINIYPQGRIQTPVPVNRTTGCHDLCCNPNPNNVLLRDFSEFSSRGLYHALDQNSIRSRDWARDYSNTINGSSASSLQSRQSSKRAKFPASLKDIRGTIFMVAKDQEGCQFLQTKCEEGKPEDIEMIFNELKDHIRELMIDASMNYLSQKLFKVCNERQMTHIVVSVITDDSNLTNICLNSHGTRAMQKLIELLTTTEQRSMVVSALRRITVTLTKNTNGHHVIQHCLKSFHVDEVQPILKVVADNCLDIATDKSGCCVLQQCVLHADGISKQRLMVEIIENALHLSEHPYGNYVVQHILGMQLPDVTADILQKLSGNFVYLAMNKYASNVVEKCLKDAPGDQSMPIIREITNSPNFLSVVQHPFGNYVVQSALQIAKGSLKEMMISKLQNEYLVLHCHPHGKRVLALARSSRPRVSPNA